MSVTVRVAVVIVGLQLFAALGLGGQSDSESESESASVLPESESRVDEVRISRLLDMWKRDHKKVYSSSAEEAFRRKIFTQHVLYHDGIAARSNLDSVDTDACGRHTRYSGWADRTESEKTQHTGHSVTGMHNVDPGAVANSVVNISARVRRLFDLWKVEHKRTYTSANDEAWRQQIFAQHVQYHDNIAAAANLAQPDMDECGRSERFSGWADMTNAEEDSHTGGSPGAGIIGLAGPRISSGLAEWHWRLPSQIAGFLLTLFAGTPPLAVDWRGHVPRVVSSAQDQGICSACCFATNGAIEGSRGLSKRSLREGSLSMQQMISCNNGCSGGLSDTALDWLASQDNAGIILNDARPLTSPFTGVSGACNVNLSDAVDNKVTVNGYISVPYDEGSMAAIVAEYGPMAVTIHTNTISSEWRNYQPGTIMRNCPDKAADHMVLLVGFGSRSLCIHHHCTPSDYWIVKNSWGGSWGDDGFMLLERGSNACGIKWNPILPTIAGGMVSSPLWLIVLSLSALGFSALALVATWRIPLVFIIAAVCAFCKRMRRRAGGNMVWKSHVI